MITQKEYAKFVYCLGYGEKHSTKNSSHPKRDGLPQLWKVFYCCISNIEGNCGFKPVLSKTEYEQRLQIDLLKSLKKYEVWLVGSSMVDLYGNGKRPGSKKMPSVIYVSWSGFTRDIVEENNSERIIVVGKGVARDTKTDLQELGEGQLFLRNSFSICSNVLMISVWLFPPSSRMTAVCLAIACIFGLSVMDLIWRSITVS